MMMGSTEEVVQEITRTHKSLPRRPELDDVEAARALIQNIEKEEKSKMDAINKMRKNSEVPLQLFEILKEMKKKLVLFQSEEQKSEPLKLLDLEAFHAQFDDFVDKASKCLSPGSTDYSSSSASTFSSSFSSSTPTPTPSVMNLDSSVASSSSRLYSDKELGRSSDRFSRDDSYVPSKNRTAPSFLVDGIGGGGGVGSSRSRIVDASLRPAIAIDQDGDKFSLTKLASLIEVSFKKGTRDLDLNNKLHDTVEWLPESIGKLSSLITLNLSENKIVALPTSIGSLCSLVRLELVPATIGNLGKLEELDLSVNELVYLPDSIGTLVSLKKLKVENNALDELPYTIDKCSNLVEFRADYNKLKGLPEAAGSLKS
ncbi:hypothetical protein Scep_000063 [Stephania cephalantha]|uniref:Disease resistance R13L4/SHOC-2-like LRR domain-containing protein n=1 Tax=Stephania cephalantha TaxID=152367 RepID=A0AAP0Q224_9MAGN